MRDADIEAVLAALNALRIDDAPTHGGRVLSYVYDSGLAELDELAARAATSVQSLNGLDPTTFPSVARMEREVIDFASDLVHGDPTHPPVGLVTSGGTESCLLAVKSARDRWRARQAADASQPGVTERPVLVAPVTVHAAFHKAAHLFDLDLDLVPVDTDGVVNPQAVYSRLRPEVALVVLSAPCYPFAVLDPIGEIAPRAAAAGVPVHVDACIGGWVLPFWGAPHAGLPPELLPPWDFRVAGVTSISLDAHKYGYAPKGASALLFADRDAKRAASFATTRWPGYPVVNPTLLGSRSAMSLAAAWAVVAYLGRAGFQRLTDRAHAATSALRECLDGIEGLTVVGDPVGPLLAVAADTSVDPAARVDPHHWADAVHAQGWTLQPQPGLDQPGGGHLPRTTHLTVTPVTADHLPALTASLTSAADEVRGREPVDLSGLLDAIPELGATGPLDSVAAERILESLGLAGSNGVPAALPAELAPVMALLDVIPAERAEQLLTELLARLNER